MKKITLTPVLSFILCVQLFVEAKAAQPNLVPQNVTLSSYSVQAGGTVTIFWTMANTGSGNCAASVTGLRLGQSPTSHPTSDYSFNSSFPTPAINANSSIQQSTTVTIPTNTAAGTYYVWVIADNVVPSTLNQTTAADDYVHSAALTVISRLPAPTISSVSPTTMPASNSNQSFKVYGNYFQTGAHLLFTDPIGNPYSSSAHPDREGPITATEFDYQLNNNSAVGTWSVKVLNPDGQSSYTIQFQVQALTPTLSISPSSVMQNSGTFTCTGSNYTPNGTVNRFIKYAGQSTYTSIASVTANSLGQISWTFAPTCTDPPVGTHTLYAVDVSTGRQSNTADETVTANPSCNAPAPSISNVSPNPIAADAANNYQTLTINGANFVNKPTIILTWTGQPNYTLPASQVTFLGSSQLTISIKLGAVADNWTVKAINPDGKSSNTVDFAVGVLPDLITSASVSSSYTAGQTGVHINVTVNRTGGNLTNGTYVLARLYFSTNSAWNAGDTQLWESNGSTPDFPNSYLNSNGSQTVDATVAIPNVSAGTYYIIAYVDPDNYHPESNENNNITAYQISVHSAVDNPPNVTAFNVTPAQANIGAAVTVSYTVTDDIGLKRVELWKGTDQNGTPQWPASATQTVQLNGVTSSTNSFTDVVSSTGTYWYGIHVVDTKEQTKTEQDAGLGPKKVIVDSSPAIQPFLAFPLRGETPWTAVINSVFDHSMKVPYAQGRNDTVIAYTGELAAKSFGTAPDMATGYRNSKGTPFVINGHYSGGSSDNSLAVNLYYDGHPGYDYRAADGTPVYADADGVVHYPASFPYVPNAADYHTLAIDHGNGYITYYLHLSTYPSLGSAVVAEGQAVHSGDLIAYSGHAAPSSNPVDPHLHFEVQYRGAPVDPYGWQGAGTDPYTTLTGITNHNLWLGSTSSSTLVISNIDPSAVQIKDWNESVTYAITVKDGTGSPVSGAIATGEDNLQSMSYTTDLRTTDINGQIIYSTTVPNNKPNGTYNITFIASKSGYTNSSTVTRQVQVNHGTTGNQNYAVDVRANKLLARPGETIIFSGHVYENGNPIQGMSVGVDDPIRLMCLVGATTTSDGSFTYSVPINQTIKAGIYTFCFYNDNVGRTFVTLTIDNGFPNRQTLDGVKIMLGTTDSLDDNTTSITVKTPAGPIEPTPTEKLRNTALRMSEFTSDWLQRAGKDFVGNPVNDIATVAAVTCILPEPVLSKVACGLVAGYLLKQEAKSVAVGLAENMIDHSNLSPSDRQQAKDLISTGECVVGVVGLDPESAVVDNISTGWSCGTAIYNMAKDANGKISSLSIAGSPISVGTPTYGISAVRLPTSVPVVFNIPTDLHETPGTIASVPLLINPSNNVVGSFDVRLFFDNTVLTYAHTFSRGWMIPADWVIDVNDSSSKGWVQIGAIPSSGKTGITSADTALILSFSVNPTATAGITDSLLLNNQYLSASDTGANTLEVNATNGFFAVSQPNTEISGRLVYFTGGKSLVGDTLTLFLRGSSTLVSQVSDANGYFKFGSVPLSSSDSLVARRISGNFVQPGTVNSADALLTFKGREGGLISLDGYQKLAADVNADGRVNSTDALAILKRATGSFSDFHKYGVDDWVFIDSSFATTADNWTTVHRYRSYVEINASQTNQSFIGIIRGDVNGSFATGSSTPTLALKGANSSIDVAAFKVPYSQKKSASYSAKNTTSTLPVLFSVPGTIQRHSGDTVQVPINIDPNSNAVGSFDATLHFNTSLLTYINYTYGQVAPQADGWVLDANPNSIAGTVTVGAFNTANPTKSLRGTGSAVSLSFVVNDTATAGDTSALDLSGLSASDTGAVSLPITGTDGKLTILVNQPISLSLPVLNARGGDSVNVPLNVTFPPNSSYSSLELTIGNFQGQLAFVDLVPDSGMTGQAGWIYKVNNTDTLLITASAGANDISGSGTLMWLKFFIPINADTGFVPLTLKSAVFNSGTTPVTLTSGGIHVQNAVLYGDVDMNGKVQAYDAALVLKYLVGKITLDTAQLIRANVSLDTSVSALDASLILSRVVGLIDILPYRATDTSFDANGLITMDSLTIAPGEVVQIPLRLVKGENILSFEGEIVYDSTSLHFGGIDWSSLANNFSVDTSVSRGVLRFAGAGVKSDGSAGTFAIVKFTVDSLHARWPIIVTLRKLRWNEGPELRNVAAAVLIVTALRQISDQIPSEFHLYQNYPNPFNPTTNIRFAISNRSQVSVKVYDVLGREAATLVNENMNPGYYSIEWDASNLPSGVYFYRITAGNFVETKKSVLVK